MPIPFVPPQPLHTPLTPSQCLVVGAGPCGLRVAIELALLGAHVVLLEKRDSFSRNNVLHLWPFTIHDLRMLGAKKFYGRFCTGMLDHISELPGGRLETRLTVGCSPEYPSLPLQVSVSSS